jgi:hypothetical protein
MEPSYKTAPQKVKISTSPKAQGFLKIFRLQHEALTVRRPKHPCLACCNTSLHGGKSSGLVPGDSNWGHHTAVCMYYSCKFRSKFSITIYKHRNHDRNYSFVHSCTCTCTAVYTCTAVRTY